MACYYVWLYYPEVYLLLLLLSLIVFLRFFVSCKCIDNREADFLHILFTAMSEQQHHLPANMFSDIVTYSTLMHVSEEKEFRILEKNRNLNNIKNNGFR